MDNGYGYLTLIMVNDTYSLMIIYWLMLVDSSVMMVNEMVNDISFQEPSKNNLS